jgi:hypothetical protein
MDVGKDGKCAPFNMFWTGKDWECIRKTKQNDGIELGI